MERDPCIHVPRTRKGGTFRHSEDVELHANDFEWDEKVAELTIAERQLVDEYMSRCMAELSRTGSWESLDEVPEKPWEMHFSATKHHFPLKNYIVHAFPLLRTVMGRRGSPAWILECGCGTGSTLLPIMRECTSPDVHFVGFDISPSALSHFRSHEIAQGYLQRNQLTLLPLAIGTSSCVTSADPTAPLAKRQRIDENATLVVDALTAADKSLQHQKFDAILLVFVLSALPTVEKMLSTIKQLKNVLKQDGILLFRDYALPDHNFFRFLSKMDNKVGNIAFAKGDCTTQVFFYKEFAAKLFSAAGLVEVDDVPSNLTYHCNRIVNRKNGKKMDKIFINGTFKLAPSS
ncbi:Methyltransferase domain containing protein, putative [Leishmania donovani]|uniref:tRNA N(3)-methylcytidine methyltransferase n=1 Tax=Leishmania donovani TaxID=5661 RepID=A0A3Q8IDT0_LEIDO|nr:Methyltransferase domain containing protein, putative [Leishmania donovani]